MKRSRSRQKSKNNTPAAGLAGEVCALPVLATSEQIASVLQVTSRTVLFWAERGLIPTAIRCGKIVRFHPPSVARALGMKITDLGTQS